MFGFFPAQSEKMLIPEVRSKEINTLISVLGSVGNAADFSVSELACSDSLQKPISFNLR